MLDNFLTWCSLMKIRLHLRQSIVFSISGRRKEPFNCMYSKIVLLILYAQSFIGTYIKMHAGVMRTHSKHPKAK